MKTSQILGATLPPRSCACLLAALLASPLGAQSVWYVDEDAAPGGDGLSWAGAFGDLQPALHAAALGDEVWVATGRYRPSELLTAGDPRSATFEIPTDVDIYGGFAGDETSLAERAGLFDRTVLSGDIGLAGSHDDDAYHVVYLPENPIGNIPSRLDGFTVVHGNANGAASPAQRGGGVYVTMSLAGPGYSAILELANCTLRDNRGTRGAALAVDNYGLVNMRDCRLEDNSALDKGGAVLVQTGILRAHNCRLARNSAARGGAVYLHSIGLDSPEPRVRFVNCLFHDNSADRGGAAFLDGASFTSGNGTWASCTLFNNVAFISGGAFFAKTGTLIPANLKIRNSILWRNRAPLNPQIFGPGSEVTYSDVGGGWPGEGNFSANPLFVSTETGNFHTLSGSPVHDAGDNLAALSDIVDLDGDGDHAEPVPIDLDGLRRFQDDPAAPDTGHGRAPLIDLGAYEF